MKACKIEGCGVTDHIVRGLCRKHHKKASRDGVLDTLADPAWPKKVTMEQRFWRSVEKTDGCWLWTSTSINGYGHFRLHGRNHYAHRVSYELHDGPVPEGQTIHHACSQRLCVNPDHLQAISQRENMAEMHERRFYKARIAELEARVAELEAMLGS